MRRRNETDNGNIKQASLVVSEINNQEREENVCMCKRKMRQLSSDILCCSEKRCEGEKNMFAILDRDGSHVSPAGTAAGCADISRARSFLV